jgi:hypothetical protein
MRRSNVVPDRSHPTMNTGDDASCRMSSLTPAPAAAVIETLPNRLRSLVYGSATSSSHPASPRIAQSVPRARMSRAQGAHHASRVVGRGTMSCLSAPDAITDEDAAPRMGNLFETTDCHHALTLQDATSGEAFSTCSACAAMGPASGLAQLCGPARASEYGARRAERGSHGTRTRQP